MKPIKLSRTESVLGVIPQLARGHGWQNEPTFIIIGDAASESYRHVCIQPDERPQRLAHLWKVAATIQDELMRCIETERQQDKCRNRKGHEGEG